ncbi:MAG: 3-isopropylmalate dehydratase small subunit [Sphingomonadales bacterium]
MDKFTTLTGVAAPLPMINIDTDMIIPKLFLKTVRRSGLGRNLFDELRFRPDGSEIEDFVLNRPPYRNASILVAGANFGCGSSREHAPWALLDFGVRCVIAPSFADIFFHNCFKNGILPIVLSQTEVSALMEHARAAPEQALTVDLPGQGISGAGDRTFTFDVDPFRKHCLLEGLDDIALTLASESRIASFENRQRRAQSWLYGASGSSA